MKRQARFYSVICSISAAFLSVGPLIAADAVGAATFQLTYHGSFNSSDALNPKESPTEYFSGSTPFTATALFDDASPNLAAPVGVPGFVAYSPLKATLKIGGDRYDLTTYNQDPVRGVTVEVFDDTTPFGPPGHYATGLLQNPVADGAGFIGDWRSASPPFSAAHLVPTEFTNYEGVGYASGPFGTDKVVPIPLSDATGNPYVLTLGAYEEEASDGAPLNTA